MPSEWKQARLTLALRRGIDTHKANYRPVSISKMFEKVIYDQTWNAFHNAVSLNLFGFINTHSCCTALLNTTEDWRKSIDNREAVAAVAQACGFSPHALELLTCWVVNNVSD